MARLDLNVIINYLRGIENHVALVPSVPGVAILIVLTGVFGVLTPASIG